MHPDKSSGPDGFNPAFYQRFWSLIGDEVFQACSSWLNNQNLPTSIGETNIVLIPKCEVPVTMKDWRPISLCNVIYKLMAKVLANRLKRCLPNPISEFQSAFVSGRSILDNVLIACEVIHHMKRKTRGNVGEVALKVDISKAYDKIDWNFLKHSMLRMGFDTRWVNIIMMCVSSVNYHVVVNDRQVGPIKPGRGLRQGDILLLYLFILCAEGFSALIQNAVSNGHLHGSKICRRAPSISHLMFADDSILFCRATSTDSLALKSLLYEYELSSGQAVNYSKSGIMFSSNVGSTRRAEAMQIMGVTQPEYWEVFGPSLSHW